MKLAWMTDLHLNFVDRSGVEKLCKEIRSSAVDTLLITGDIATARGVCRYLEYLADEIRKPIYFVLGNHDYYGSSIRSVNLAMKKLVASHTHLFWLSAQLQPIELSPDTCLIGHEGLADGRLGDPEGSQVIINDYLRIKELIQPNKELRLQAQHKLGDAAARHLKRQVNAAVKRYRNIIAALHVPPFPEACWHLGQNTDDSYLPHFGCKATGDVLRAAMLKHPEVSMTVYCGHTHSGGYAEILPNLKVHTAGAAYYQPRIEQILTIA
jgi:Icc-related predicted phosphoesterase